MGKFAKKLEELNAAPRTVKLAAEIEKYGGIVADAYPYYGMVKEMGAKLGFWEGEASVRDLLNDAVKALSNAIEEAEATILDLTHRSSVEDFRRDLLGFDDPIKDTISQLSDVADGNTVLDNALQASLLKDAYPGHYLESPVWTLPAFADLHHNNMWSDTVVPPLDGDRIYMFLITVPAYLRALADWLAVRTTILAAPFGHASRSMVHAHMERLEEMYYRWMSGFATLHIPSVDQLLPVLPLRAQGTPVTSVLGDKPGHVWYVTPPEWERKGQLWGAVESWTGTASIFSYDLDLDLPTPPDPADFPFHFEGETPPQTIDESVPPSDPEPPDPHPQLIIDEYPKALATYRADYAANTYPRFYRRLAALRLREQKIVYNSLPLADMMRMRNLLGTFIDEEPRSVPGSPGHWSIREFELVTSYPPREPEHDAPTISVRRLASELGVSFASGTVSLRAVFHDLDGKVE